jgi:hypothetical protein
LREVKAPTLLRQTPYAPAALYPQVSLFFKDSWYSFLLEAESTPGPVRPEGLGQFKKSTSSGLEPPTFRLAAWCLNHYATACPLRSLIILTLFTIILAEKLLPFQYKFLKPSNHKFVMCTTKFEVQKHSTFYHRVYLRISHKSQNMYWRFFPQGKSDRAVKLTTHHLVPRSRKRRCIHSLSHTSSRHGQIYLNYLHEYQNIQRLFPKQY